ncbi:MAG: hypothetical protein H6623_06145 [Bdellovibrionaceae bacterium]|nr:hypothetical protein [Pseudobdellovibrionaceae bacterium]
MKAPLFIVFTLFIFSVHAKVTAPTVVQPSASQKELIEELNGIDEDIDFDTDDDLFIMTADDAQNMVVDEEIEKIALENQPASEETKDQSTTTTKK